MTACGSAAFLFPRSNNSLAFFTNSCQLQALGDGIANHLGGHGLDHEAYGIEFLGLHDVLRLGGGAHQHNLGLNPCFFRAFRVSMPFMPSIST